MAKLYSKQKLPFLFLFFLLILPLPFTLFASNTDLQVHVIDVGLGDCILIKLPQGTSMLVDTGSHESGPEVIKYLKEQNIEKINHLILTHSHDDHSGGVMAIADNFSVGKFYDNGAHKIDSSLSKDYLALVRSNKDRYEVLQAGRSLAFNDIKLDVLNPPSPPAIDSNNNSIVIRLTYKKFSLLLAGDMGFAGEQRILDLDGPFKSQVLKVAHHGENDSTSAEFLQRVDPEAAIITVSRINKYSRPHKQLLSRLMESGAEIYRSDIHGDIILMTDGNSFSVRSEK